MPWLIESVEVPGRYLATSGHARLWWCGDTDLALQFLSEREALEFAKAMHGRVFTEQWKVVQAK